MVLRSKLQKYSYALLQGWQNLGIYEYFQSRQEIPGYPGIYLGNTKYFPLLVFPATANSLKVSLFTRKFAVFCSTDSVLLLISARMLEQIPAQL